jgi:hypothetical protein
MLRKCGRGPFWNTSPELPLVCLVAVLSTIHMSHGSSDYSSNFGHHLSEPHGCTLFESLNDPDELRIRWAEDLLVRLARHICK